MPATSAVTTARRGGVYRFAVLGPHSVSRVLPFVASALAVVLLSLSLVGCRESGRDSYVKANERLFASLPRFPNAKLKSETSTPYSEEDSPHVLGYVTRFDFALPAGPAVAPDVRSFFTRRLRPDWLWVETLDGPVLNFRRGKAFVSINLASQRTHLLEVAVDQDYYGKLGRCGIPGGCGGSPAWSEIQRAILDCRAKTVSQTHALDVTATLESGRTLQAKEPAIDAILDVLHASRCHSQPAFATE